jgi:hypothetical protein
LSRRSGDGCTGTKKDGDAFTLVLTAAGIDNSRADPTIPCKTATG